MLIILQEKAAMKKLRIAIGCDHAGYEMKNDIIRHFSDSLDFLDSGTFSEESCDYPDFAHASCEKFTSGEADFVVLLCGSGNGMAITANKHHNIRCALVWTDELSKLARLHNNANAIAIPARFITVQQACDIIEAFLNTEFEGGRHLRRVEKISAGLHL